MKNPQTVNKLIAYQEGAVVSREIAKKSGTTITMFAFDSGQGLSEHATPYDAYVLITDGEARVKLSGVTYTVKSGEMLSIPANTPHFLDADKPFRMLLIMIRQ